MIASVAGAIVSVRLTVAVCAVGVVESVTLNVSGVELGPAGVPLIRPLAAFSVSGLGSDPDVMLQLYGVVPPLAANDCEYAVPAVPPGSELVVIASVAGAIVSVRLTVAVCAVGVVESVTLNVSGVELGPVGVPLIRPLAAFSVSGLGSDPDVILQLYGVVPPLAANDCEYAVPAVPPGKELVVITNGAGAIVSVKLTVAVFAVGVVESVTLNVSGVELGPAGVPLIRPLAAFSVSGLGSDPDVMLQLYGVVPPLAANDCEYAVPAVPPGSELVVIASVAGAIVSVRLTVAVCAVGVVESVTLNVSGVELGPVGVPLIRPLAAFSVSGLGSDPDVMLQLYGVVPPLAANDCEYAVPAVPPGSELVVIASVAGAIVSVRLTVAVCAVGVVESVTLNVSGVELGPAGVPLIRPLAAFSVSGLGSDPDVILQLYGVVPPLAANDCEYAVPAVPPGSELVVIASVAGAIVSVRLTVAVCAVGVVESVTLNVSGIELGPAGVPLIRPLAAFSVSGLGSDPDVMLQLYGVVPPLAANDCEYAVPAVPPGSELVVIASVAGAIVSVRLTVAVCAVGVVESVTLNVSGVELGPVGVPLIRPLAAFSVSGLGSDPDVILQLYGVVPPLAANDCEYAVPAVPPGKELVVITNGAGAIVSVKLTVAVFAVGVVESVTLNVSGVELGPAGVPLIRPLAAFSVSGLGSDPDVMLQLYGVVPPLAANDCEYAVPAVPPGSELVVIASVAGAIVSVRLTVAVCAVGVVESVTLNVSGVELGPVGVPLIRPLAAFSVSGLGSDPDVMLQLYGVVPPLAANDCEYAVPAVPPGSELVVIASVAGAIVSVRLTVAVCAVGVVESVTLNVSGVELGPAGVPLIRPLAAFSVSGLGSDPDVMLQLYGVVPPLAARVAA